jgi:hypothetical protein
VVDRLVREAAHLDDPNKKLDPHSFKKNEEDFLNVTSAHSDENTLLRHV